jgi:hypothetical protein
MHKQLYGRVQTNRINLCKRGLIENEEQKSQESRITPESVGASSRSVSRILDSIHTQGEVIPHQYFLKDPLSYCALE